eukprot:1151547-Rhodomonas_salina.1
MDHLPDDGGGRVVPDLDRVVDGERDEEALLREDEDLADRVQVAAALLRELLDQELAAHVPDLDAAVVGGLLRAHARRGCVRLARRHSHRLARRSRR